MTDSQPLVSIIIPCYNHERFVQDCIRSVIDQTYSNIELIIIDDGSKDNSVQFIEGLIKECQSRFTRFEFRSRPNKGLSATLNEALEWIQGKYVGCIASDDMLIEDKTEIQVAYLESHPDTVAVFGAVKLIDNDNKILGSVKAQAGPRSLKSMMLEGTRISAPTQMMRTEAVRKTGGYKENLIIEDAYMWFKLSKIGNLQVLGNIFALYRRHESNTSSDFEKMHKARFELANEFKGSEYYDLYIKRIKWFNTFELFVHTKIKRPYYLAKMIYIDPQRTVKKFKEKLVKIVS